MLDDTQEAELYEKLEETNKQLKKALEELTVLKPPKSKNESEDFDSVTETVLELQNKIENIESKIENIFKSSEKSESRKSILEWLGGK